MRTFSIITLGCKVNQYESQQIRRLLEELGFSQVEPHAKSDLVVVNTCCVTHIASAKSRQYIHRAQKVSADAAVVVCGCLPTVQIGELSEMGRNVHIVRERNGLVGTLRQIAEGKTGHSFVQGNKVTDKVIKAENSSNINLKNNLYNLLELPQLNSFKGQTRAFLKVQDGCDGYCSYCIVPKTRPLVHSKPLDAVLQEAQSLVRAGHKEIVVTGIFLGAYGQESVRRKTWPDEQNEKLADLLEKMAEIPNLARIRLSSLEPADVTPRLVETFCSHPKIMPHLHLSLQSGSDKVLKRMGRQYNAGEFREKVALLKSRLDRPAITTDIIIGFPGETDADFQQTMDLAKEAGFAKMHIFSFSPRKGTAAASMQDAVDNRVIKERSGILRDLESELGRAYRQQFVGESAEILIENNDGQVCGRSERYFMVYLAKSAKKPARNELVRAKLLENSKNGVVGEM
jgi:threonylcarbamoyladenosine tRNA methylthiotransferase MtaB